MNEDSPNDPEAPDIDRLLALSRRGLLTAGAVGLGLAGVDTATADHGGDSNAANSKFAVKEHDHSGHFDTATRLGESAPVESIRTEQVNDAAYPQTAEDIKGTIESAPNGQTIFLPSAQDEYEIDNPINIIGQTIKVVGTTGGGILKKANDRPMFDIRGGQCTFSGVRVHGLGGSTGSTDGWYTDEEQRVGRIYFHECEARHCGRDGFHLESANVSYFESCQPWSNWRDGFFIGGTNANASTFVAFDANGNGRHGINVTRAYNTTLIGGYSARNGTRARVDNDMRGAGYHLNSNHIHAHGIGGEANNAGVIVGERGQQGNIFVGNLAKGVLNNSEGVNVWGANPDVGLNFGGLTGNYLGVSSPKTASSWQTNQDPRNGDYVAKPSGVDGQDVNFRLDGDANSDFENAVPGQGVRLTTTDNSAQYRLRVDNDGNLVTEEVPYDPAAGGLAIENRSLTVDGSLDELEGVPPTFTVAEDFSVFRGEPTVSGQLWITWDADALYLVGDLTDDTHSQENSGSDLYRGDSLQFAFSPGEPGESDVWDETDVALTPEGPQVVRRKIPAGSSELLDVPIEVVRDESANRTVYEVAYPWEEFEVDAANDVISLALTIIDYDGDSETGLLEQSGGIFGGKENAEFAEADLIEN